MRQYLLAWCALWLLTGCASTRFVDSPGGTNRPRLELREAQSATRPAPAPNQLLVRYLRAGGVYFEWQGQALMTAPFMTNYPLVAPPARHRFDVQALPQILPREKLRYDQAAIDHVLAELPLPRVAAILSGHSHYDHLGDLPRVARMTPGARIFVNDSGQKILASAPELAGRVRSVEGHRGPIWACNTPTCLIRFWVMPSEHAPNLAFGGATVHWAPGEVPAPLAPPFTSHALLELQEGHTLAFVIDFMDPKDPARIAYRIHYQDAASRPPLGFPAPFLLAERPVDLEVVTMPGREALPKSDVAYPAGILRYTHARHALVIHYEDFFHRVLDPSGKVDEVRILPTLAGSRATEFLATVTESIADPAPGPCAKPASVEGLCGRAFTLPLPGEWLLFDVPAH